MNYGNGSLGFTNKNAGGGGGTVTRADDHGLSVVGADVQLGGNPLLHDSNFDLANFLFSISNNSGAYTGLLLDGNSGSEEAVLVSPAQTVSI